MPTQLITQLQARIQQHLAANATLTIDASILDVPNLDQLLRAVMAASDVVLTDATVSVGDTFVSVTGKAKLLSNADLPLRVELLDVAGKLQIKIAWEQALDLADAAQQLLGGAFAVPDRLGALKLVSIDLPIADESATITAQAGAPLDLGAGRVVLGPPVTFRLEASNLLQPTRTITGHLQSHLTIAGRTLGITGAFKVGEEADAVFQIQPGLESLSDLVSKLLGVEVPWLESLPVSDLQLGKFLVSEKFELSGKVADRWSIPLGLTGVEVHDTHFRLHWDGGNVKGVLDAKVSLGGTVVDISSDLSGDLTIGGRLPSVNLLSVVENVSGTSLSIPSGFPTISLPESTFVIQLTGNSARLLLEATSPEFGIVRALILEEAEVWQAAFILALPVDWKFSKLSSLLAPLDVLRIKPPILMLASFESANAVLPTISSGDLQFAVKRGLSLGTGLLLEGGGLDFVKQLIGQNELPLQLTVSDSFAATTVRAAFGQKMDIVPGVIVFDDFGLDIKPQPFVIGLACRAFVSVAGQKLPEFTVSTAIAEDSTRLVLQTAEAWHEPFGISGLTINQLIFQMETAPVPKYAVLGDITVANKTIKAAVELTGSFPSMIFGQLDGKLSLAEVVRDLVGLSLPAVLDISISDFMMRAVGDPLGVTIGDEHFDPGLSLQGTLGFLGVELFGKIVVDPGSGVLAHASLKQMVQVGNLLTISNANGDGPPSATLDTRQSPFLVVSGRYNLLGLVGESIQSEVTGAGMSFSITGEVLLANYSLSCRMESLDNFSATGSFSFGIKESIGPITVSSGLSMGRINIDTGFEGSASLSLANQQFQAALSGGFHFQGLSLSIPDVRVSVTPGSLEEFPQLMVIQLINNAKDIFAEFLLNPDKWLLAIRDGVVDGVESVARVLSTEFNRSAEQIGSDIRNTLNLGSETAAEGLREIGESAEKVAEVLKGIGDLQDAVTQALVTANFSEADIEAAIQAVFSPIKHIDESTPHVDNSTHVDETPTPHTDRWDHLDETPVKHLDTTEHTDLTLNPHTDTTEHTDRRVLRQHVDVTFGHVDIPKGHSDIDNHIDTPEQHTDASNHVDIPAAHIDENPHVDIPSVHTDMTIPDHVDI